MPIVCEGPLGLPRAVLTDAACLSASSQKNYTETHVHLHMLLFNPLRMVSASKPSSIETWLTLYVWWGAQKNTQNLQREMIVNFHLVLW